jgi:hypothetical protein
MAGLVSEGGEVEGAVGNCLGSRWQLRGQASSDEVLVPC